MCGIAGIVLRAGAGVDGERVRAAGATLRHRGPDDLGFLAWGPSGVRVGRDPAICAGARGALLHRRLSILDLTEAGWQPMGTADGRNHLVFNGEIYNFRELRQELEQQGERFISTGDTEVLLRAWARWGADALPRLVGMFAFAVLDVAAGRLDLVRDFFGIKPLYYCSWRGGFAFASEIKTLLALADLPARAHPQRLYDYLRFGLTDHTPQTMFDGIAQVPPAHRVEVDLDRAAAAPARRYWEIDLEQRSEIGFAAACEELRGRFLESVRLHLRSDVPLGAALSGGVDSSAIVMAMRHLEGDSVDLHAVSYVADDPRVSEERWIELVARGAGAVLHRTRPEPAELTRDLETLIAVQDEPFGSTSIYAQHRVFRLAREAGIKVMLDGQGADELLGGYRTYLAARFAAMLRQGRWAAAARLLRSAGRLPGTRARDVLVWAGYLLLPRALHRFARGLAGKDLAPRWLDARWFRSRGVPLDSPLPRSARRDALREMLWLTLSSSSLPMLLRYEDRNSMAHSIESRVPFLTPRIASFVLSLPERYIVSDDGTSKAVFREAMRGIVPDAVLDRRDKIGFATPELQWLSRLRPWVDGILGGETARCLPWFDRAGVREEWEAVLHGSRRFDWHVWRWINTIRWVERFGLAVDP